MREYTARRQSNLEKEVARQLMEGLQETAQTTLHTECEMTTIWSIVEQLPESERLPLSAYVQYVAVQALTDFPEMNAHLTADGLCCYTHVKLGVMVDTGHGVMMACVPNADSKSIHELFNEVDTFHERAHEGLIRIEETRGATFNIVDLSQYAVDSFHPLLVPTAVAVLGIGRVRQVCRPDSAGGTRTAHVMSLGLTIDHRGSDGIRAGRYLTNVVLRLENAIGIRDYVYKGADGLVS